jgi:hypothetical protein
LSETTVEFDSSRYAGINLIITNDLDSDIFLRATPSDGFVADPIKTDNAVRLPDTDERYRLLDKQYEGRGIILHWVKYAETFFFVWSGNTGFQHIYNPQLSSDRSYFPITYYHCKDKGFYIRTVRIIEANK